MTPPAPRSSLFRSALAAEEPVTLGTWIKLPAVEAVELISLAGFDFIVIDLEHAPLNLETTSAMIGAALHTGLSPLVRVPTLDSGIAAKVLDAGAEGLVVPHVDTADEARAAVDATRFPPLGGRGVGSTSRAGAWGALPRDEYLRFGQEEVTVIAQIESTAGVANAEAIASTPGVDALLVGPADLSAGVQRSELDPVVTGMIADVVRSGRAAGVPVGNVGAVQPDHVRATLRDGFAFTLLSNDASLLGAAAVSAVQLARATVRDA